MSTAFALNNNRQVLEMLHNSPRFGAPNEAVDNTGIGATEFSQDSVNGEYFAGLFTSIAIMGIVTIIWLCALPCAAACCREKCFPSQVCARFMFFFALFWSIIGFFISTGGISDFESGSTGGFDTLLAFANDLVDTTNDFKDLVNFDIPALSELINTTAAECGAQVEANLPDVGEFEIGLQADDVTEFFGDFDVEVLDAQAAADAFINPLENTLNVSVALTIIYLLIFFAVTSIAFNYDWKKNAGKTVDENSFMAQVSSCNKSFGCPIFMCCGIILVLVTVASAGIIGVIATLGADQCVPSVREDILALVSGDINPDVDQLCGLQDLDGASDEELTNYFTCHYLTCGGDDLLLREAGIEKQNVNGDVVLTSAELDRLIDEIVNEIANSQGVVSQECSDGLDALLVEARALVASGLELLEFVTCENLTPFWIDLLDETLCNELIAGLGVIYISWLLGAIALMAALCAYPAIVFFDPNAGKQQAYIHPPLGVVQEAKAVEVPVEVPVEAIKVE